MFLTPPSHQQGPVTNQGPGAGACGDWRSQPQPQADGPTAEGPQALAAPGSPGGCHAAHRPTLSLLPPAPSHVRPEQAAPHSHGAHPGPGAYHGHAANASHGTHTPGAAPAIHMGHAPYPPTPSPRAEGLGAQGERARAPESSVSLFPAALGLPGQGHPGQGTVQHYTAPGAYRPQEAPEETAPAGLGQGPSPHLGDLSPSAGPVHLQPYGSGAPPGYTRRDTPSHAKEAGAKDAAQWRPYQAPPAGYPLLPSLQGHQGAGGNLAVPPSTPMGHTPHAPQHANSPASHAASSHPPHMPPPFYSPQPGATPGAPGVHSQGSPPAPGGALAPFQLQNATPVLLPLTQALSSAPHAQAHSEEALGAPGSTAPSSFGVHRRKQGLDRRDLPEDGYSWHKYGHKTLMGLFSRAYYRCTQRGSGCRAKKTVDTALKGTNEVRITYDGGHNHDPEREVLEGVMVVNLADAKGRGLGQGQGQGGESPKAAIGSPAQHAPRPALGAPSLPAPGRGEGGGGKGSPAVRGEVEIRQRKQRKVVVLDSNSGTEAQGAAAPEAYRKCKVAEEGEASSGDEGGWRGDAAGKRGRGAFDGLASPQFTRRTFDGPVGSHVGAQGSPLGKPRVHHTLAPAPAQGAAQRPSRDPFQEHQDRFLEQLASRQRWAGDDAGHAPGHASGSPRSEDSAVLEQLSPGHGQGPANDMGHGIPSSDSDKKLGKLSDFSLCGPAAASHLPMHRREAGGLDLDLKL